MPPPRLILASASPRRSQLLAEAGFAFDVDPADVDEEALSRGVAPDRLPTRLATEKARRVADRHDADAVVLAADTIVLSSRGEVLNKPTGAADARRMLALLSGTRHRVVTGVCILRGGGGGGEDDRTFAVRSDVQMRPLTPAELDAYVATGDWQGKAGGYGIQDTPGRAIGEGGGGDPFIEEIAGELTNIIGLPMPQVIDALAELGVTPV